MIDTKKIALAHDAMDQEYDNIDDLWYPHLFNAIHEVLLEYLPLVTGGTALDVGCGTGFQSLFLARSGYRVLGFDVSEKLLACARSKTQQEQLPWPGFTTGMKEYMDEQKVLVQRADAKRGTTAYMDPDFRQGDAIDPSWYPIAAYDVITCCGSVLSFIDDHKSVIEQMAAALRPGGRIVLEVEQRVNFDLFWPIVDWALRDRIGFEQKLGVTFKNLMKCPGDNLKIDFPFELGDGREIILPIWLFSIEYLENIFSSSGLHILTRQGVHSITNFIPSTVLHKQNPSLQMQRAFRMLRALERKVWRRWPFWRLGCSVIYVLVRK